MQTEPPSGLIYLTCISQAYLIILSIGRSEPDGTRWSMGGEVKGKDVEWVASSLALYVGTWSIHGLSTDPHSSTASSRLKWPPRRFKWTRPFCWKTKSGFCACAIMYRMGCTSLFHVRSFCSRMSGRICKIVGKPDYISVFLNQCTTASWFTMCCTHLTVVHKVWQYHHFLSPSLCCFLLCFCFLHVSYFHIIACHFSGQSFPISTFYLLFQILIFFLWVAIHH